MKRIALALSAAAAALAAAAWPQEAREGTRALWDSTFLRQRPQAKAALAPPASKDSAPPPLPGALVGVTVWRLRPSSTLDEPGARVFVHSEKGDESWTPERVPLDAPLIEGQRFRFSFESARTGYLYVIDREEYADGTRGDPVLLFPAASIRGGKNRVSAGTVVEIPSWDDNPPYVWLKKSRPDHVAEVLTVLVTPTPLEGISPASKPQVLNPEQVAAWEKRWGAEVTRLDAGGKAGKPYTAAEKAAAAGERPLTSSDPVPQTLYFVKSGAGEPVLVNVPLRIRK